MFRTYQMDDPWLVVFLFADFMKYQSHVEVAVYVEVT